MSRSSRTAARLCTRLAKFTCQYAGRRYTATPANMEPAQRSAARGQNGATALPAIADEVCRALTMGYECRAGGFRRSVHGYVLAMPDPKPEDVDFHEVARAVRLVVLSDHPIDRDCLHRRRARQHRVRP